MAQLVSAPDCGSGDRGFESHYPPFFIAHFSMGYRQVVRHSTLTAACAGSNPAGPDSFGALAQVVEHLTFNQVVGGSIPPCLIIDLPADAYFDRLFLYSLFHADMAELADAPDLGSGGNPVQVQVLLSALILRIP